MGKVLNLPVRVRQVGQGKTKFFKAGLLVISVTQMGTGIMPGVGECALVTILTYPRKTYFFDLSAPCLEGSYLCEKLGIWPEQADEVAQVLEIAIASVAAAN